MPTELSAEPTTPSKTPGIRTWTWSRLPKVSRAHQLQARPGANEARPAQLAAAASECLSRALQAEFHVQVALHPQLLVPTRSFAHHTAFFLFDGPAGRPSLLELDGDGAIDIARRLIGGTAEPSKPCGLLPLERAALTHLALTCLRHFATSEAAAPASVMRLVAVADRRDHALAHLEREGPQGAFDITLRLPDARYDGRFWIPPEALVQAAAQFATRATPAPTSLSMRAACVVATSRSALARANRGDVLTLGLRLLANGQLAGPLHLRARGFSLAGIADASGFSISEVHTHAPRSHTMTHVPNDESTAVEDVPVSVEVELARLAVPLGTLAGTQPGGVLPLHISCIAPITLRLEGRKFALAELVELDGELGARILEVYP